MSYSIIFIMGLSLLLGGCFGSFANMLIYRLCSNQPFFTSRSICPTCKQILGFLDLIPIFSYILRRGRCYKCHESISIRYLIVELLCPILFFLFLYPPSFMFMNGYYLLFGYILLILFFTDLETYLLPLPLTCLLLLLGLFTSFITDLFVTRLISTVIVATCFFTFRYIVNLIYKQDTFGLGDIILLIGLSLNFGWKICLSSFYCAVIIGGFYSIVLILFKQRSRRDLIPFGPFIIIGFLCSFKFLNSVMPLFFVP